MPLVDLLEGEPAGLVHQVDEAEVARAHDDDAAVADLVLRRLLLLLAGGLAHRLADHRVVLVARPHRGHARAPQVALDQLVQAVAVALLERGALRLAVVGEHDDLVGTRGILASARDPAELLVDLAQHLHRVGALEPGMVGDLVVAGEARVDSRDAVHHVADDAVDREVPDEDGQAGADERVAERTVTARSHVAAALAHRARSTRWPARSRRARRCG